MFSFLKSPIFFRINIAQNIIQLFLFLNNILSVTAAFTLAVPFLTAKIIKILIALSVFLRFI